MSDYEKYTDDVIALVVVSVTMWSYLVPNVSLPTEPMMLVLGYFFGKKVTLANAKVEA